MARNYNINSNLKKKLRRQIEEYVNERALKIGREKSKEVAELFQKTARETLLSNSNASPESEHLIQSIANSITVEEDTRTLSRRTGTGSKNKVETGYVVRVPIDREGLVVFLEYGTGLEGLRDQHEEVKLGSVNWEYANRRNEVNPITGQPHYITRDGKRGFVFRDKLNNYIDANDVKFHNQYTITERWVKGYVRSDGTIVKPYKRHLKNPKLITRKKTYVLSSGIKPVRFIYKAKQEVRYAINNKQI